ncbi:MAG: DUF3568 family protein [Planctomycetota bacterium]
MRLLAAALLAGSCGGCAAAAAVPIFSVASAGASTANVGYATWRGSRLQYVDLVGIDRMTSAALTVFDELSLTVSEPRDTALEAVIVERSYVVRTERGRLAEIQIDRLTPSMTRFTIDVGLFGDRASARLLVDSIQRELRRMIDADAAAGRSPGAADP